jgi:tripartite-type tricarboxylate transporter receptor subunit TctC
MTNNSVFGGAFLVMSLLFQTGMVSAQTPADTYPAKAIRIVVPFPPGSAADIVARAVGTKLTEKWGQQVVVDPRPGASGIVASEIVARSAPDGYTLIMGTAATHTINISLYPKLPYDPVRDFAPVVLASLVPNVLAVHPSVPVKSVKELITLAKARPGMLSYASSGSGTSPHLAGELFKNMAGVDILHVPYKGSPQALTDTISGQVTMQFAPMLTVLPHLKSRRLNGLAVTTAKRFSAAPELPTIDESGLPGYEATLWYGMLAPQGTQRSIVLKLNKEVLSILALPEVRESLSRQGADTMSNSPEQFGAYIAAEIVKWAKVIKISGAKVD